MAHYFFDTSALVKRHVIETGSRWVKDLALVMYAKEKGYLREAPKR
jgi:hypothetical protein